MQLRPIEVVAVGAGVVLFDLVFCGLIAPKIFSFLDLQAEQPRRCCAKCETGHNCKNITDRAQLIDMTPVSPSVNGQMVRLPGSAKRMV